jgi:hypothetical protein
MTKDDHKEKVETTCYPTEFFAGIDKGSTQSAKVILSMLFDMHTVKSIVDVGCGQGAWLAVADVFGVERLCGLDGSWVDKNWLLSRRMEFTATNLEQPVKLRERFDLCLSVEVAEHLSPGASEVFVKSLCSTSDVIVFSAAIPKQGGVNHLNEQWQSFWAKLFEAEDYVCLDILRPRIWMLEEVEPWYRQNVLVYVKRGHPLCSKFAPAESSSAQLDLVHPRIYEGNIENYARQLERPSLKLCVSLFGRWVKQRMCRASAAQ